MKKLYLFLLIALVFTACKQEQPEQTTTEDKRMWEPITSYIEGVYEGELPCVDCEGRQVKVKLNMDMSAMTTIAKVGNNTSATTKLGNWSLTEDVVTISFANAESIYFQALPDQLVEMKDSTTKYMGKKVKKYTLTKTD